MISIENSHYILQESVGFSIDYATKVRKKHDTPHVRQRNSQIFFSNHPTTILHDKVNISMLFDAVLACKTRGCIYHKVEMSIHGRESLGGAEEVSSQNDEDMNP